MGNTLLGRLLSKRIFLLVPAHLLVFGFSYALAMQLRFDFSVPADEARLFWKTLPWILLVKLAIFHTVGSLHGWWRYVTFADLASLLKASTVSTLGILCIDYCLISRFQISRAVLLLDWGTTIFLVGGLRSACRIMREHVWPRLAEDDRPSALMIGVTAGGKALSWPVHNHSRMQHRIVGYLDDDASNRGSLLGGIPFLGTPDDAVRLASEHDVEDVLVVTNALSGERLRALVNRCRGADINVRMIPPVDELLNGRQQFEIRDVAIADLLQRDPVELDRTAIAGMVKGRRVMVTGAGGSIGSEICRQVMKCRPEMLVLVERGENSLFYIERELGRDGGHVVLRPYVADVCDRRRMAPIFSRHRPQIVFHAAAHKHVPLMEENPGEALANNTLGTKKLADMAERYAVDRFVLISTDKAVHPTSVMGVSKQLAERYVHALSETSSTKFVVVRFGNVLASAGSVVPLFQEQIRRGGPITVTHPDMKRYFMTIPEASQLVLQAAAMGRGGEIFVLDMGEPVKIVDLAKDLVRLSGLSMEDIEIRFSGPRPGEKLFEELNLDDERMLPTPHPRLRVAYHQPYALAEVLDLIAKLPPLIHQQRETIRRRLMELVPEYISSTADLPAKRAVAVEAAEPAAEDTQVTA